MISLLSLIGCTQDPALVGTSVEYYDWQCIKTDSDIGVGFSGGGKAVLTVNDTCSRSECFLMKKTYGKYVTSTKHTRIKLVDITNCPME